MVLSVHLLGGRPGRRPRFGTARLVRRQRPKNQGPPANDRSLDRRARHAAVRPRRHRFGLYAFEKLESKLPNDFGLRIPDSGAIIMEVSFCQTISFNADTFEYDVVSQDNGNATI